MTNKNDLSQVTELALVSLLFPLKIVPENLITYVVVSSLWSSAVSQIASCVPNLTSGIAIKYYNRQVNLQLLNKCVQFIFFALGVASISCIPAVFTVDDFRGLG